MSTKTRSIVQARTSDGPVARYSRNGLSEGTKTGLGSTVVHPPAIFLDAEIMEEFRLSCQADSKTHHMPMPWRPVPRRHQGGN